jgi:tRNA threonylcarbamoyl adenosine modification protein YeaZ
MIDEAILVIDTGTRPGFVAVWAPEQRLAYREFSHARRQGEEIADCIRATLRESGFGAPTTALPALRAIAVATGPGSFSSVRIGLGAAKSLAETAGTPLVGVSLLDAASLAAPHGACLVTLPASRGEWYFAFYGEDGRISGVPSVSSLQRIMQVEQFRAVKGWIQVVEPANAPHGGLGSSPFGPGSSPSGLGAPVGQADLTLVEGIGIPTLGDHPSPNGDPPFSLMDSPQLAEMLVREAWRRIHSTSLDDPLSLDALYVRRDDADGAWTDPKADLSRITAAPFPAGFPR